MTTPAEIFDGAAVTIFQTAADPGPATFIPATGDPISGCHVDIRKDINYASNGTDGQVWNVGTVLEYLLAEIGREVAIGETFTVGSTTWTVKKILTNDGRFSKAVVK